jgi:hypothetical protein
MVRRTEPRIRAGARRTELVPEPIGSARVSTTVVPLIADETERSGYTLSRGAARADGGLVSISRRVWARTLNKVRASRCQRHDAGVAGDVTKRQPCP